MIMYVVTDTTEHMKRVGHHETALKLEQLSDDLCLLIHYSKVSMECLEQVKPWAIVHSGSGTDYDQYDVLEAEPYCRVVKESEVPQLGICGGHQIVAHFFGSELGPMRALDPDEPDFFPEYNAGFFKEKGMWPVYVHTDDPLFADLPPTLRVSESHYWEIKQLGKELKPLARSHDCEVQAYVHQHRPVYGVQFHPERATEQYPHGTKLLENFFAIARSHTAA